MVVFRAPKSVLSQTFNVKVFEASSAIWPSCPEPVGIDEKVMLVALMVPVSVFVPSLNSAPNNATVQSGISLLAPCLIRSCESWVARASALGVDPSSNKVKSKLNTAAPCVLMSEEKLTGSAVGPAVRVDAPRVAAGSEAMVISSNLILSLAPEPELA